MGLSPSTEDGGSGLVMRKASIGGGWLMMTGTTGLAGISGVGWSSGSLRYADGTGGTGGCSVMSSVIRAVVVEEGLVEGCGSKVSQNPYTTSELTDNSFDALNILPNMPFALFLSVCNAWSALSPSAIAVNVPSYSPLDYFLSTGHYFLSTCCSSSQISSPYALHWADSSDPHC